MSLEQALQENTAAVKELIVLMKAGGTTAGAGTTSGADTSKSTKGTTSKSTKTTTTKQKAEVVDPDTLKAKLVDYKNLTDMKAAKALTKDLGYDAIADVPEEKSKEVYDAIVAAIADLDNGNNADDNGEEDL